MKWAYKANIPALKDQKLLLEFCPDIFSVVECCLYKLHKNENSATTKNSLETSITCIAFSVIFFEPIFLCAGL